jgi:hypothetical protein
MATDRRVVIIMHREADLHLPIKGWGRIDLAASASRAGTAWTDHGTACQERGLKHRAAHETRTIPVPPDLVKLLRAHLKRYGTAADGRSLIPIYARQLARGSRAGQEVPAEAEAAHKRAAVKPGVAELPAGPGQMSS